ncbi:MAG TPA: zinc-binding dehydrogenase [Solirubrobacterales bacterium]|nr:zinc-binding dehydrogenase [Solirubrobacterales bacterium]
MLAAYAAKIDPENPLAGLEIGEVPEPAVPEGWVEVEVRAAALNHHDVWSLRGQGLPEERLPMILGCDAAGVDPDGNEVLLHAVISSPDWRGDDSLDPKRTLLSELHPGTLAERVAIPRHNLVPKPAGLSFAEAACLPTAYLTAYRMLFTRSGLRAGDTVLIQGAGGGVASAAIQLARAGGFRVWATSREERKRAYAEELGAHAAFESGQRLPEKVDAVLETVGEATWKHSMRALKPGGRIVVSGATSGFNPPADLPRIFFLQLEVVGSTMGSREELGQLVSLVDATGLRPRIDRTLPLAEVATGIEALVAGDVLGKIVIEAG